MLTFRQKLPFYVRMLTGLIAAFILVGFLAGNGTKAMVFAFVLTTMWVLNRILIEALEAWQVLVYINKNPEMQLDERSDDPPDQPVGQ